MLLLLFTYTTAESNVSSADAVKLPKPEEIPNIELEVCNYHHPVLGELWNPFVKFRLLINWACVGTFHAKFMVVSDYTERLCYVPDQPIYRSIAALL